MAVWMLHGTDLLGYRTYLKSRWWNKLQMVSLKGDSTSTCQVDAGFCIKNCVGTSTSPIPPPYKPSFSIPMVNMKCQGESEFLEHANYNVLHDERNVIVDGLFSHGQI